MADFVTLTCPSCGGKLKITSDIDRFACGHCGTEHIVKRGDGIVALSPVVEGLKKVQLGVDKTASELAIKRLKEEIYNLEIEAKKLKSRLRQNDLTPMSHEFFLHRASKRMSFLAYLRYQLQIVDRIPDLETISVQELQEMIDYYSTWVGKNSKKSKQIQSIAENIKTIEELLLKKRAELTKHQQIVSQ